MGTAENSNRPRDTKHITMESEKTPLLLHSSDSISGSGMKRRPYSNADNAAQGQQTLQAEQARVPPTCSVREAGRHLRGQHGPACPQQDRTHKAGTGPMMPAGDTRRTRPHPRCRRTLAAPLPTHLPVPRSQGEPSRASRPFPACLADTGMALPARPELQAGLPAPDLQAGPVR